MKNCLYALLILFMPTASIANGDSTAVYSIEGITNEMLNIISVDIGEEVDWEAFRNLFLPTAQLMSNIIDQNGQQRMSVMNLEEFIRFVGPNYARYGFEEHSLGAEVDSFNGVATVFQGFYCKNLTGTYENRGINTYQLVHVQGRWWIASTLFTNEDADHPLPVKYQE